MHGSPLRALLLFSTLTACSDWPQYQHVVPTTDGDIPAGTDPRSLVEVTWERGEIVAEPNNAPVNGAALPLGEGWVRFEALDGWGWNSNLVAERADMCGNVSAFPPAPEGDYTGDVDWIAMEPIEDGTLCATMKLEPVDDVPLDPPSFDMMLFTVDSCGVPINVTLKEDSGDDDALDSVLGWGLGGWEAEWSVQVSRDISLGLVLAGYWPDDPELNINWLLALSLVPSKADGKGLGTCPLFPEALFPEVAN